MIMDVDKSDFCNNVYEFFEVLKDFLIMFFGFFF